MGVGDGEVGEFDDLVVGAAGCGGVEDVDCDGFLVVGSGLLVVLGERHVPAFEQDVLGSELVQLLSDCLQVVDIRGRAVVYVSVS